MPQLRAATLTDVPQIADVIIAAMPFSSQWDYRFPHRHWLVYVVEPSPSEDAESVGVTEPGEGNTLQENNTPCEKKPATIVAVAVWDISYINKRKNGPSYEPFSPSAYVAKHGGSTRRDCNPAHHRAFQDTARQAKQLLLGYGDDQIHLQILATHPDHWRYGYGTMLCEWGLQVASEEALVVSLAASKTGKYLYEHLGFKNSGTVTGREPGEEETVSSTVFVYNPKEHNNVSGGNHSA
ncbi:hypothetical protein O1611_g1965 [Lasiodiplodia mahajangana]|uniref:Uncharacterized protein n=1 Tax=Lasiodiplodia mahajangana TaxID=1108764 RepID=A0ACC2JVX6_9PEZI|nr:hypothetical protein O1611_g1965 [Lasiodiplodia mahajangana]